MDLDVALFVEHIVEVPVASSFGVSALASQSTAGEIVPGVVLAVAVAVFLFGRHFALLVHPLADVDTVTAVASRVDAGCGSVFVVDGEFDLSVAIGVGFTADKGAVFEVARGFEASIEVFVVFDVGHVLAVCVKEGAQVFRTVSVAVFDLTFPVAAFVFDAHAPGRVEV